MHHGRVFNHASFLEEEGPGGLFLCLRHLMGHMPWAAPPAAKKPYTPRAEEGGNTAAHSAHTALGPTTTRVDTVRRGGEQHVTGLTQTHTRMKAK